MPCVQGLMHESANGFIPRLSGSPCLSFNFCQLMSNCRTSRGLEITPAGRDLCKKAQEVLAVAQGLREYVTKLRTAARVRYQEKPSRPLDWQFSQLSETKLEVNVKRIAVSVHR